MNRSDHFVSDFNVSLVEQGSSVAEYSFRARGAGSRAIEVEVVPRGGRAWVGRFAAPEPGVSALSALLGTPDPTWLCIIERGHAFLGNVLEPTTFHELGIAGPVVSAVEAVADGALLLVTPWTVANVGSEGLVWVSPRLAIDGLRIDEVEMGWIAGVADPLDEEGRPFALDLATGELIGPPQGTAFAR